MTVKPVSHFYLHKTCKWYQVCLSHWQNDFFSYGNHLSCIGSLISFTNQIKPWATQSCSRDNKPDWSWSHVWGSQV